jgi:c-di-GMP-binding flagellar brake protein YcgR
MMSCIERKPAVHDQVLVEAELGGRVVGLRAVIVNVMQTTLWLGLVRPDPSLERLRPDQPLHLTFRYSGAAMVAASTFLSHLGASRSRLFSIEWPTDLQLIQRRAYLRLDADCPIQYTVVSQGNSGSAGRTGRGLTRNISAGGLQFRIRAALDEPVEPGDELEIYIALGSHGVAAEAEVIRVDDAEELGAAGKPRPAAHGKGPTALIAVRFTSISEGAQDRIVRHIFSLQRKRRRQPQDQVASNWPGGGR